MDENQISRILHEIKMFNYNYQWFINTIFGDIALNTENESTVHFDSYLVHYRHLFDFFSKDFSSRKEDIFSKNFGFPKIIMKNSPKISRDNINKIIFHMTDHRIEEDDVDWYITEHMEILVPTMIQFIEHLISNGDIENKANKVLANKLLRDMKLFPDTLVLWDKK